MLAPAVVCVFCEQSVDPRKQGNFRKVIGWTENRARGGANAIRDREELGEYAHGECMKRRKWGIAPGQSGLFRW